MKTSGPSLSPLNAGEWIGFTTRTVPLHRLRIVGTMCATFGILPLMVGGFPLLSSTRDTDYEVAIIILFFGIGLLVVGLLMIMFDAFRQKRELKKGELNAKGVFWNPKTQERLEGLFHFNIDSGAKMPGDRTGFRHRCHGVQYGPTRTGIATETSQTDNPVLRLVFTVRDGMTNGEFAGSIFTSRTFTDLDAIIFTRGSITRLNGKKANPCWLCSEIGAELSHEGAVCPINVQIVVNPDMKSAVTTQSSNAGVIGAGLGGAIGGAIGASMDEKRVQEQWQQLLADYQLEVTTLFSGLRKVAERFGWTAKIVCALNWRF